MQLVAEASADGDLVASLGTTAAEYGCARLGLHPGKKPVGLRAVAAIRLKGTLRHLTRPLLNFFTLYNSPLVYPKADAIPKKAVNEGFRFQTQISIQHASRMRSQSELFRTSQGMVQRNFYLGIA